MTLVVAAQDEEVAVRAGRTDALADRWGTRRTDSGLEVWAEIAGGAAGGVSE